MNKEYRLIHFNCARPFGEFNFDNEFVRVFIVDSATHFHGC
ncbi:hypothetical protein HY3_04400 [Hyphomonas pacifica]|uniref:Uncharacterized protein n=1 Tax=Hyphomonas pacifica TaxID=1280941 RepID=A0A8B2PLN3_9PROT|nr:hypothetical protein HY3_04400 [Hyphomonas pacifica]